MRAMLALILWLTGLGGVGICMADDRDEAHLADMIAPPWKASPNEQATADRVGFDACEQVVKVLAARGDGKLANAAYTTSRRWGKVLRAKIADDAGGAPTLVTCWIGADGNASIAVKIDDGEP